MLEDAQWDVLVHPSRIDDGDLEPGDVHPAAWTQALAWLKARAVFDELGSQDCPILAADTVCVHAGRITGQPSDVDHARTMIVSMCDTQHDVWTGYCILGPTGPRRMGADRAVVTVGAVDAHEIETYLESGRWRGKAGAYNLSERVEAGWPIAWDGEASTIMGLPMPLITDDLSNMAQVS